jgi:hypothetical protein
MTKIRNVNDLSRYKQGDVAWWVVLRPKKIADSTLEKGDEWMIEHHPKVLFTRGPCRNVWKQNVRLPHLHHSDFAIVTNILTSTVMIEEFMINEIIRSKDTGEFFYANVDNEWMPESYLFDSKAAARRERSRIMKLMSIWVKDNS